MPEKLAWKLADRRPERVAASLVGQPWAILPEKMEAIARVLELRLSGDRFTQDEVVARIGLEPKEREPFQILDGVAIINVFGVLEKRANLFTQISGGSSTDILKREFTQAAEDASVKSIVLNIDSPGGALQGTMEFADAVFAGRRSKRIVAIANENANSAAYLIASAAREVVVTKTALSGNIGTLLILQEFSRREGMEGIRTNIIKAGALKAAGNPHQPMTDPERAFLQDRVDAAFGLFAGAVARNRGLSMQSIERTEARAFMGQEAVAVGLADGVMTLDELLDRERSRAARPASTIVTSQAILAKEGTMGDALRALLCETFGMPEESSEAEAKGFLRATLNARSIEWSDDEAVLVEALQASERIAAQTSRPTPAPQPQPAAAPAAQPPSPAAAAGPRDISAEVRQAIAEQRREERQIEANIRTECARFGLEDQAETIISQCASVADAHSRILDLVAERQSRDDLPGGTLEVGPAQIDKHDGMIRTALLMQALDGHDFGEQTLESVLPASERAENWREFQNVGLLEMATQCLEMHGVRTRGMPRDTIAMAALGFHQQAGVRMGPEYGYHTTGNFANLTLDAINKTLLAAYMEAPSTWEAVFRRGRSVPDFKDIHRIRLGEIPNLDQWPDNTEPNTASFADEKETYAVEAYSLESSFSYRLLVNDDMDGLVRMPIMLGNAARRTVNSHVWSIVTSNPTMTDGQTLFLATAAGNRFKINQISSGSGAPTVNRIGKGRELMRLQVGVNQPGNTASQAILNLVPATIVVPAAIETATEQLVRSGVDPDGTVTNVFNPFQAMRMVTEPLLDANSSTAWYLFAQTSQIDTIECTFMQGQETPRVMSRQDPMTLALIYKVLQSFAAKAIDFRGCFKDDGVA